MRIRMTFEGQAHESTWEQWRADNADALHPDELDALFHDLDEDGRATTVEGCVLERLDSA